MRLHPSVLAARLDRPQSFVSKVEKGERRLALIKLLLYAQALEFDPARFLKVYQKHARGFLAEMSQKA